MVEGVGVEADAVVVVRGVVVVLRRGVVLFVGVGVGLRGVVVLFVWVGVGVGVLSTLGT